MSTPYAMALLSQSDMLALRKQAQRVHKRFFASCSSACDPEDLVQQTVEILLKLSNKPDNILAYAMIILRNEASKIKRRCREVPEGKPEEYIQQHDQTDSDYTIYEMLSTGTKTLREILDQIRWGLNPKNNVNFWCVWLLRMRLGAARRIRQERGTDFDNEEILKIIYQCVVWHQDEEQSLLHRNWPRVLLEHVGGHVLQRVCELRDTSSQTVSQAISGIATEPVSAEQWDQWSSRARTMARNKYDLYNQIKHLD